jgi:hypothetical protein
MCLTAPSTRYAVLPCSSASRWIVLASGARIHFTLGGQRGAMLLVSKAGGKVPAADGDAASPTQ